MEISPNWMDLNLSASTSSAEDSPVKTSRSPESKPELRALARGFGLSMPVLLGSFDLDTCSLKTSQVCLFTMQCDEWLESWPDSGMWGSGEVFELRNSEPPTCESGCSWWPTPRTLTGGGESAERKQELGRTESGGGDLQAAAATWAKPQAHDGHGPKTLEQIQAMREKNGAGVRNLNEDVTLWQTPAADSFRSRGGDRKMEMGLDRQARFFPTPAARDYRTPNRKPLRERCGGLKGERLQNFVAHSLPVPTIEDGPVSSTSGPGSRRRLNPRFVEWLMGFPIGWTEL